MQSEHTNVRKVNIFVVVASRSSSFFSISRADLVILTFDLSPANVSANYSHCHTNLM